MAESTLADKAAAAAAGRCLLGLQLLGRVSCGEAARAQRGAEDGRVEPCRRCSCAQQV
jgi:hypothetical protein